jgi:hypothetical protein
MVVRAFAWRTLKKLMYLLECLNKTLCNTMNYSAVRANGTEGQLTHIDQ